MFNRINLVSYIMSLICKYIIINTINYNGGDPGDMGTESMADNHSSGGDPGDMGTESMAD